MSGTHTLGRVHGKGSERLLRCSSPAARPAPLRSRTPGCTETSLTPAAARRDVYQMCMWQRSFSPSSPSLAGAGPAPAPAPWCGRGPWSLMPGPGLWSQVLLLVPAPVPGRIRQAAEHGGPQAGHGGDVWVGAGWAPAAPGAADFQTFLLCVAGTTSAHNVIKRLKSLSSAASSK